MRLVFSILCALGLLVAGPAFALNPGLGPPPGGLDRDNPSATVHGFLDAAHDGHYEVAAHYLYLDFLPPQQQAEEGRRLARRLKFVLDRKVWIDFAHISKDPAGDPVHEYWDQVGTIPLGNTNQPIRVSRVNDGTGQAVWVFSPETVKSIDRLYEAYGPPLGETLPDALFRHNVLQLEPWQWIGVAVMLFLSTLLAFVGERLLVAIGRRFTRLTPVSWDDDLVAATKGPLRMPLWAGLVAIGTRELLLPPTPQKIFDVLCRSAMIIATAWYLLRVLGLVSRAVQDRASVQAELTSSEAPPLQGMRTQLTVLRRVAVVAIHVVAGALLLMQFSVVRHVGVSLLASAGLAGLVLGVAAQRSIAALLAGLQLSITRPICLGDVVLVEGESGVVEEITLTYVVIRIWDQRRLVIPMNYFLEKPFQNWSKGGGELTATAMVRIHQQADVDAFRVEMKRALEAEARALWDGRVPNLIATEGTDRTLLLRAVVGATSRDASFELRRVLQRRFDALLHEHPEWLPPSALSMRHGKPGAQPPSAH